MLIRYFTNQDAEEVSALIARTLREVNNKDYTSEYIERCILHLQPSDLIKRASETHFYVFCENEMIIGCGAIGPYWEHMDQSSLFTIFVHVDYIGKGVGRKIIETLENDEYFIRVKRVEIPASITATPFYLKMGYTYKNGIIEPDEEGLLRLEKHRTN